jgi:hypothetical protein
MVQKREVFESRTRLSTKRANGPLLTSAFHPFLPLRSVARVREVAPRLYPNSDPEISTFE